MPTLRAQVIKLASERPDLRSKLLPLVVASTMKQALALNVGQTIENEKTMLRFHRGSDSVRVTDMTNAGKRGKRVEEFALYGLDRRDPEFLKGLEKVIGSMVRAKNYKDALSKVRKYVEDFKGVGGPEYEEGLQKGVEVTPAGFKPIKVDGKYVSIEASYRDFVIRDKEDKYNEPTCIARGKRSVKLFYRWVQDNLSKLPNMKFGQVTNALGKAGIDYHSYCAMD